MDHLDNERGPAYLVAGSQTQLLRQAQAGNEVAFANLWELYGKRVVGLARHAFEQYGIGGADAEAVAQDVFIDLWRQCPALENRDQLLHWLFCAARRNVIDEFRKRSADKRNKEVSESALGGLHDGSIGGVAAVPGDLPTPLEDAKRNELLAAFAVAIAMLPPRERMAYTLRNNVLIGESGKARVDPGGGKLTFSEIAEALGVKTQQGARWVVVQAEQHLKENLEKLNVDIKEP